MTAADKDCLISEVDFKFAILQNCQKHLTMIEQQAVGALGELSDKSDFSLLAWDSFSQEIRDLLLFYCQKSLNLFQMQ